MTSKTFSVGYIQTSNPHKLHVDLENLRKELMEDDAELDILIDEIANANVDDLKSALTTVMDDKDTFKAIVEDYIPTGTVAYCMDTATYEMWSAFKKQWY